ncbi:MAG: SDR family oxidoreductase [Salaquimonas sp.]
MTTILITGVYRGIGRQLAEQALAKGWKAFGSVRSEEQAAELQTVLGQGFTPLVFDVTDAAAIKKAATSASEPIDIVINNSGIIGPSEQSTLTMDFDGFAETLAINTLGPLRVAQAFLTHLKASSSPRLITISSKMGSMAFTASDRIAYRASKAAVNKVVQGLATDLRGDGIAVISMHPGWVRTDMGGGAADISPSESAAGILQTAEKLTLDGTGQFVNYDGEILPW